MKTLSKIAACIAALMFSMAAQAVGVYTGVITYVDPMGTGQLLIGVTSISTPACPTFPRFLLDATTTAGKVQADWVRTAFVLGKTVTIYGNGTCPTVPFAWQSEAVDYLIINF